MASNSASRTFWQKAVLYSRRFCGFMLYISLQLLAWYAIILLTSSSHDLADKLQITLANYQWLKGFADTLAVSIVPIAVTVINTIMPIIIKVSSTNVIIYYSSKFTQSVRRGAQCIVHTCIQALLFTSWLRLPHRHHSVDLYILAQR
jgi:hypothetical protein